MKKNLFFPISLAFYFISLIFHFTACSNEEPIGVKPSINRYPTISGHQWEYKTSTTLEYYDSNGNIVSTEILNFDNTIVTITAINDTVQNFMNLIRFEAYDVSTQTTTNTTWYSNSEEGLFGIAYRNAGTSQVILPKSISNFDSIVESMLSSRFMMPVFEFNQNALVDTILFYEPPRKALHYPLMIGARWVELINPFYRERFIDTSQLVQIQAGNFNCFVIEADWSMNIEFTDYLNLTDGLIKRRIYSDSLAITTIGNPDPIGYARVTTISKLVSKNF